MKTQKSPNRGAWLRWLVLAMLVGTAVWLSASQTTAPAEPAALPPPAPTPAKEERSLREQAYDKDVAALTALLDSGAADAATQAQAAASLERLVAEHQCETAIEETLQKAGIAPCLVLMSGGALTVMVDQADVDAETSAAILSLCMAHAQIGAENIRIMGR